jgi:hypothetical protein
MASLGGMAAICGSCHDGIVLDYINPAGARDMCNEEEHKRE